MERRGGIEASKLVSFILLIIGFIVVAFFLTSFFGGEGGIDSLSERELCKLSVITRATTSDVLQAAVPLKCTTEKVCISNSGRKDACPQFAGEENIKAVKLRGNVEDKAEIIEKESANAMYDCWDMMGQGKLDIFGKAWDKIGLSLKKSSCVICSRVALGDDVENEKEGIMDEVNLDEYMRTKLVPGSELTYLQTFTDRQFSSYPRIDESGFKGDEKRLEGTSNDQIAFVFMQIKPEHYGDVFGNLAFLGGSALAGGFMIPGGSLVGRALFLNTAGIALTTIAVAGVSTTAAYNVYEGQMAAAGFCGSFTSNEEAKQMGCSIVQGVNYNFEDINALCGSIQGDP